MSEPEEAIEANADVQETGGAKSYPDWLQGDPDPDRLVSYADNLRRERQELKEKLAGWDDEESAFARVQEKFPHWLEDGSEETDEDDEEEFDEEDPRDHKLSELESRQQAHDEWITQQQREASLRAFDKDVDTLSSDREVEFDQDDRVLIAQQAAAYSNGQGFTKKELEKAVDWLIARDERIAQQRMDKVKSSKRAPHVPSGGTAGKGPQPDLDADDPQVRERARMEFYAQRLNPPAG